MSRLTTHSLRFARPRPRPYRLSDGRGLALQIMPNGTKAWRFRYGIARRGKMISLGLYPAVPIEEARDTIERGTDPNYARRARKYVETRTRTFSALVDCWLAKLSSSPHINTPAWVR